MLGDRHRPAFGLLSAWRGRGVGTLAQRELVRYLFTHTRVERVQATTDPENLAEIRCLEKVGFRLEGRVRRAQWRGGRWYDQLLYSLLRDELDAPDELDEPDELREPDAPDELRDESHDGSARTTGT
ncbi:GNAT family N-acetyltransferase [Streptosporangium saharense]|uniref:GNAT family N-acetyltransferase n=1 Tax=Streptosporangium saharense TaxID=1706840 RepID=UPI0036C46710